jgi:hypothetical protein
MYTGQTHQLGCRQMKIELLKNAFRSVTRQEEAAMAALAMVPRKRRVLPVAGTHFDTVNEAPSVDREVLLSHAAMTFDPQRMERREAEGLIEFLQEGELLPTAEGRQLLVQLRASTDDEATVDLLSFVRTMLPDAPAKRIGLSLLNDIVGLRFRAAG